MCQGQNQTQAAIYAAVADLIARQAIPDQPYTFIPEGTPPRFCGYPVVTSSNSGDSFNLVGYFDGTDKIYDMVNSAWIDLTALPNGNGNTPNSPLSRKNQYGIPLGAYGVGVLLGLLVVIGGLIKFS